MARPLDMGESLIGAHLRFALDREAVALADRLRSAIGSAARVHAAGNMYWPGWTEITVSHQAAEKGAAVSALLEDLLPTPRSLPAAII